MKTWKAASFNVNSIRARLTILLEWLHLENPDVICLQETKVQDREFPLDEIRDAGYHAAFRGEKSYNGVAILSRSEPKAVVHGLGGKNPDPARLIAAVIDGISVVNTYVPQGRDTESEHFQYKLQWFDRLLAFFQKNYSPDLPLLWAGDLNIAPEDKDVHDPKRLRGHPDFHPEVQAKLAKIMEWGFHDVFRQHNQEGGQYTFFDYRVKDSMKRGLGWRVDHLIATKPLLDMSTRAFIDLRPRAMDKPSDHTPIAAEFELK